jgi:hypothetical protein
LFASLPQCLHSQWLSLYFCTVSLLSLQCHLHDKAGRQMCCGKNEGWMTVG